MRGVLFKGSVHRHGRATRGRAVAPDGHVSRRPIQASNRRPCGKCRDSPPRSCRRRSRRRTPRNLPRRCSRIQRSTRIRSWPPPCIRTSLGSSSGPRGSETHPGKSGLVRETRHPPNSYSVPRIAAAHDHAACKAGASDLRNPSAPLVWSTTVDLTRGNARPRIFSGYSDSKLANHAPTATWVVNVGNGASAPTTKTGTGVAVCVPVDHVTPCCSANWRASNAERASWW